MTEAGHLTFLQEFVQTSFQAGTFWRSMILKALAPENVGAGLAHRAGGELPFAWRRAGARPAVLSRALIS